MLGCFFVESSQAPYPESSGGLRAHCDALRSMAPTVKGGAARLYRHRTRDTMDDVDLLVIGGGINGAGIARDASGRGLRVLLCEQHDLAAHTSAPAAS